MLDRVFEDVARRVEERSNSLGGLKLLAEKQHVGVEGWLKVEACAALGDRVNRINREGADLDLASGERLELKGSTDWPVGDHIKAAKEHRAPALFLCRVTTNGDRTGEYVQKGFEVVAKHFFSDGDVDWAVGLIRDVEQAS